MTESNLPPPLSEHTSEDDASSSDAPSGYGSGWADRRTLEIENDPLLGTVLSDTYRISRVIGEGGMGRVYEAWHTRISKKRYAIKVLHPEYARNEGILKRFQREAETAASVSHPNAVGVYDVALTPQDRPYLVSEYLEGLDLAHRIKQAHPLPETFVRHVALQVASALIEAHSRGVVHRDLKPQNIFLLYGPSGEIPALPIAKVLDFGLSRFLDDSDSELTRSGMVMGTPSYMSPEQARGERADHRVDVYGIGAMLFACVAGRPPFKSVSPQATVLAVMNEEAPRPSKLNPDVSPDLELIIQKAMSRDPNRRYGTMQELYQALEMLNSEAENPRPSRLPLDSLTRRAESPSLRGQLVAYWVVSLVGGLSASLAALWGGVVLRHGVWPLEPRVTFWLALVVAAAFGAPLISTVRTLRSRIWGNTAMVAQALSTTRRVALSGATAYASVNTLLLMLNVAGELYPRWDVLRQTALSTFPGVALVAFAAGALAALAAGFREHLLAPGGWVACAQTPEQNRHRRLIAGPATVVAALLLVSSSIVAARSWPLTNTPAANVELSSLAPVGLPTPKPSVEAASNVPRQALASTQGSDPATEAPAITRPEPGDDERDLGQASVEDVSLAISQGTEGLLELVRRYPNDPGALRALAFDQASRSTSLVQAAETFKTLFRVDPAAVHNEDIQQIVVSMARSNGTAMHKAFELMAGEMGHVGPDLLYRLSASDRERRAQARAYLARSSVRQRFSPALQVTFDFQFAPSCSTREALLPRVTQFGDERTLMLLNNYGSNTKTGCGAKKNLPCRAKCPDYSVSFERAAKVIAARIQSGASGTSRNR
jgi:serine/threonine protein kinase